MNIHFQADDIRVAVSRDADGKYIPSLAAARNGTALVELSKAELESTLLAVAQAIGQEHGATIDGLELTLTSTGPRQIKANLKIRARKGFFPAVVTAAGLIDVDEALNISISNLVAGGEGMIGSMISSLAKSTLKEYEGRKFPLAGQYLKNARVENLVVDVTNGLRITAKYSA